MDFISSGRDVLAFGIVSHVFNVRAMVDRVSCGESHRRRIRLGNIRQWDTFTRIFYLRLRIHTALYIPRTFDINFSSRNGYQVAYVP